MAAEKEGSLKTGMKDFGLLRIQADWQDGITRNGQKVWVSCSVPGMKTIYGDILSKGSKENESKIEATEEFSAECISKRSIRVSYPSQNISSVFHAPFATFKAIHKKSVNCLDVSSGGALGVSSSEDGTLNIWNTSDGKIRRQLEGHVDTAIHCKFFPSGIVALSGGVDMTIRIWSAENGSCPRVLTGHKGAITDTAIVGKGRNIISCSRDGSARLWNCGDGKCIRILAERDSVINSCALGTNEQCGISQSQTQETGDSITGGKILLLAREDGYIEGIDFQNGEKVFQSQCKSAVNSCAMILEHDAIACCENGNVFHFDIRNMTSPISILKLGNSSVNHVTRFSNGVLLARGDGVVQLLDIRNSESHELVQLTGPDSDPIYRTSCHGNEIFTACRDGLIRKYRV
eukprot:Seg1509.10 transcript_id=Seg1509.10/GoldUCD/mRNA.D3Y31 product="Proteasomal ATPase-associated factor 1" protein_id=Seg1509.10/GoldUCD/D3Y31